MKGVVPLASSTPARRAREGRPPVARAPSPQSPPNNHRGGAQSQPAPAGGAKPAPSELGLALEAEKAACKKLNMELDAERALRQAQDTALAAERTEAVSLREKLAGLAADRERLREERDALVAEAALRSNPNAASATPDPGGAGSSLRQVLERRGLRSEDEFTLAFRALLDQRRLPELLAHLSVAEPDALLSLLERRLVLLAEGDEEPPGVALLRVTSERSEGEPPSAVRDSLRRFSTACLVHNLRSVVIVGGSPAYHRSLREGLDSRIRLRLVPGNSRGHIPEIPSADLVIVWAGTELDHRVSQRFPDAMIVPHRGISRMLGAAVERIEGRSTGSPRADRTDG